MLVQEPYSVSQSARRLTNLRFRDFFVFTLSSLSSVFVVATAHMACLSLDEVNGSL